MAPTGPMTSWQILLEIRAASSRSVGWARSVINWTSSLVGFLGCARPLTDCSSRDAGRHKRLRIDEALIHASRRRCQGRAPADPTSTQEYCFFVTTPVQLA